MNLQTAREYIGQVVRIVDADFSGYGVFIGFADPENGNLSSTVPCAWDLQFPYRVVIQGIAHTVTINGERVEHKNYYPVAVHDFVPVCPECSSDWDDEHSRCTAQCDKAVDIMVA